MRLVRVCSEADLATFFEVERTVYKDVPQHRLTDHELIRSLVNGSALYTKHASVTPLLLVEQDIPVGRLLLIRDLNLPEYVQIAFFEAMPGIDGLVEALVATARKLHPECRHLVAGLNGHLNYGAGFLLDRHEEVPMYELPYTPLYYRDYFQSFRERQMVTFRFHMEEFYAWGEKLRLATDLRGITVRYLDPTEFDRDIGIYTELNNSCFFNHPYWAERSPDEDIEMFRSMGDFFRAENLLIAEQDGKPIGYLLWMPDLNELIGSNEELGDLQVRRYQDGYKFRSYRFSEIAVRPEVRGPATLALFLRMLVPVEQLGCEWGEGGFIFADNIRSINMTKRFYQRIYGFEGTPYRTLAVYEADL